MAGRQADGGRRIQDAAEFFRLWHDRGRKIIDIAAHFGVSPATVSMTARRLGLGRRQVVRRAEHQGPVPTPAEIEARTAEIQAGWSDEEREKRRVTRSRPVTVVRVKGW